MAALMDSLQQLLMRRALDAWLDLPRAVHTYDHAPIAEWHQRLDVLEARLAERRMRRLDAEATLPEKGPTDGMDDDA